MFHLQALIRGWNGMMAWSERVRMYATYVTRHKNLGDWTFMEVRTANWRAGQSQKSRPHEYMPHRMLAKVSK